MKRLALILLLAGCDAPPDIGAVDSSGPDPVLLPLDQLNARAGGDLSGPQTASDLDARAAALRARAAALR
ncbi:hypothetical protein [Falsirhodobacter xinxiangensis]|uniref:hypothetical protein n=1 Tax=Falsirhodobacter xinxiangensis TaxID=2530049 RepID=UPI0010AAACF6|nr:hypothetical protein [Rhodobacter xinxiangensis]